LKLFFAVKFAMDILLCFLSGLKRLRVQLVVATHTI